MQTNQEFNILHIVTHLLLNESVVLCDYGNNVFLIFFKSQEKIALFIGIIKKSKNGGKSILKFISTA